MTIPCYILDDEFHCVEILRSYIERTPDLRLAGHSTNPLVALNEVARGQEPLIVFLDIHMPELSGLQFAELLQGQANIIFTTSFPDHALQAYEQDGLDYVLKPISYERFLKSVQKAKRAIKSDEDYASISQKHFYVKTDVRNKYTRILLDDIIFVEAASNYVHIYTPAKKYITYLTLNEIEGFLPANRFVKLHRSFLVNNAKVVTIEAGRLTMENGMIVPIARNFRHLLPDLLGTHVLESRRKH